MMTTTTTIMIIMIMMFMVMLMMPMMTMMMIGGDHNNEEEVKMTNHESRCVLVFVFVTRIDVLGRVYLFLLPAHMVSTESQTVHYSGAKYTKRHYF